MLYRYAHHKLHIEMLHLLVTPPCTVERNLVSHASETCNAVQTDVRFGEFGESRKHTCHT